MSADEQYDNAGWAAQRREMIDTQLVSRGIRDPQVLQAMATVPREEFVSPHLRDSAYEDRALPVGPGQTISQPYIVAYMTEALDVSAGMRVLEVGGGTGYQAALLSVLGARVDSIEVDPLLMRTARERLERLGYSGVRFHCGDGSLGLPDAEPFDRILVTAGTPSVPAPLVEQLVDGGRMILPVGSASRQTLVSVVRRGGRMTECPLLQCRFVKLIGEHGWESENGTD